MCDYIKYQEYKEAPILTVTGTSAACRSLTLVCLSKGVVSGSLKVLEANLDYK